MGIIVRIRSEIPNSADMPSCTAVRTGSQVVMQATRRHSEADDLKDPNPPESNGFLRHGGLF